MSAGLRPSSPRRGYALLAALWLVVALATLGAAAALAAREALAAASNRTALVRASWRVQGCAERVRATLDAVLAAEQAHPGGVFERWRALDRAFDEAAPAPTWHPCTVQLQPVGARVDLNALDPVAFDALLRAIAIPAPRADSLARALDAWRAGTQAGTAPAPVGTVAATRGLEPRALVAVGELGDVPGFDSATVVAVSEVADVEPGRISLAHASAPVLASLPGFGPEVIAAVLDRRARGLSVDLADLAANVSRLAASDLRGAAGQLARRATLDPDAWLLSVTSDGDRSAAPSLVAPSSTPPSRVRARLVLRIARAGVRVVVMRRRSAW